MLGMSAATMALSLGLPALALALLGSAGAVFVYLPVVGRGLAAILLAASAGVFAYDAGYRERGALDGSANLRVQVAEANALAAQARADLQYTQGIAKDAQAARELAEDAAEQVRKEADDYEKQLSARPVSGGCALSRGDVAGLRRIGGK